MALPFSQLRRVVLPVLRQSSSIQLAGSNVSTLSPCRLPSKSTLEACGRSKPLNDAMAGGTGTSLNGGIVSRNYHSLTRRLDDMNKLCGLFSRALISTPPFLQSPPSSSPLINSSRNVTKCSLLKGRRKTVGAIKHRFLRLDWGAWISAQPGRFRHLWKKRPETVKELRHHVFRSPEETLVLNNMCTRYWIKKKHFVDDPYESYHTRDNFPITKGLQGINTLKFKQTCKFDNDRVKPIFHKMKKKGIRPKYIKYFNLNPNKKFMTFHY